MKHQTSSRVLEKINVAKGRIRELQTMINHWKSRKVVDFWETECSLHPSSPACLIFNE